MSNNNINSAIITLAWCCLGCIYAIASLASLWLAFMNNGSFWQRVGYGVLTVIQVFMAMVFLPQIQIGSEKK